VNTGICSSMVVGAQGYNRGITSFTSSSNVMQLRWSPFIALFVAEDAAKSRQAIIMRFLSLSGH